MGLLQREVPLQVTIIGDADKEPANQAEKQKILATIEKHGLRPKVRLLGYQPHPVFVAEAYGHHVFLSPSVSARNGDTEGDAPVSIIEGRRDRDADGLASHLRWLTEHPDRWSDLTAKGLARLPILGRAVAALLQDLVGFIGRHRNLSSLTSRTSRIFPLEYFVIAEKSGAVADAPGSVKGTLKMYRQGGGKVSL